MRGGLGGAARGGKMSHVEESVKYCLLSGLCTLYVSSFQHYEIAITPRQSYAASFGRGPCAMISERE